MDKFVIVTLRNTANASGSEVEHQIRQLLQTPALKKSFTIEKISVLEDVPSIVA
jgi:hypothetical protein